MENFKHLPEPLHIHVIEPVKYITRAYRGEAVTKSGMNPFLLDSEDVFVNLLTDSGVGAVAQNMQTAMTRGGGTYSGSHSYYTLTELVKNIFGYQYIISTHQGRGTEQIYIPILIKKREQRKSLDRSKMTAFSNYFFDITQGHNQINGCTVRNVYIEETFDTDVRYDSKNNFDLERSECGIGEAGPNNVPYTVTTITSNSAGGQPVPLADLKVMYSVAKRYDIPMVMDSARLTENAYFIKRREAEYKDWTIEQTTRETYKYVDTPAMSAKKDAMVLMGGLLCMEGGSFFDVYTRCRTLCMVQKGFPTYSGLKDGVVKRLAVGLYNGMNLDWLTYCIAQVQYLVDGPEEIGVVCQQAGGHAVPVDAGKLLSHIPADQFPAQALTCEPYKIAGIRVVETGSLLLDRDPKTGEQLPCPAEPLRLTIPRVTYTRTHMNFIIEAFKHVKENAANIKGLAFTYEPKVLRHFAVRLREV